MPDSMGGQPDASPLSHAFSNDFPNTLNGRDGLTWLDFLRNGAPAERPAPLERRTSADRKRRYTGAEQEGRSYPYPQYASGDTPSGSRPYHDMAGGSRSTAIDLTGSSPPQSVPQRTSGSRGVYRGITVDPRTLDTHPTRRREAEIVVPPWQPDADVTRCPVCDTEFSFWYRKHHCRKCGRVVCNACSPHRITIPRQFIVQPPNPYADELESASSPEEASANSALGGGEIVRVCNPCVPDPWTPNTGNSDRPLPGLPAEHPPRPAPEPTSSLPHGRENYYRHMREDALRRMQPPDLLPPPPAPGHHHRHRSQTYHTSRVPPHPPVPMTGQNPPDNPPSFSQPGPHPPRKPHASLRYTSANPSSGHPAGTSSHPRRHTHTSSASATTTNRHDPYFNSLSHLPPPYPDRHPPRFSSSSSSSPSNPNTTASDRHWGHSLMPLAGLGPPTGFPSSANPPPSLPFPAVSPPSASPSPLPPPPPATRPPRREVREEDECPVCGIELPPGDELREAHVQECIAVRFASGGGGGGGGGGGEGGNGGGTPGVVVVSGGGGGGGGAIPNPISNDINLNNNNNNNNNTNSQIAAVEGFAEGNAGDAAAGGTRPRATSYRPRGMAISRATEKDCVSGDGEPVECVICFEEFQQGDELGRMECLCRFHRACIRAWWERKGVGSCPTHQSHE